MLEVNNLRHWRQRRALSQVDLADRSGVEQATIARIESRKTARPSTVRKLASALEISVEELMGQGTEPGNMAAAA